MPSTPERWQDGQMVLRVNGHLYLPALRVALDQTIAAVTPGKEDAA